MPVILFKLTSMQHETFKRNATVGYLGLQWMNFIFTPKKHSLSNIFCQGSCLQNSLRTGVFKVSPQFVAIVSGSFKFLLTGEVKAVFLDVKVRLTVV